MIATTVVTRSSTAAGAYWSSMGTPMIARTKTGWAFEKIGANLKEE
jgi:hypothetical protein